jgi:hypothetical protein
MTPAEVEELVAFTKTIAQATLEQLTPIIIISLDGMIDALRMAAPRAPALEIAAALSAELHKRQQRPPVAWAPIVGNA